ncbi:sensor histidine kinase [Oricola thermophila]|uniref:histidine kinase n=1 Tax=Oricola thermophila TaxID=2742145 RepID=A0A6N1VCE3_9HYPH|nr:HAMP domain-containing sensor histidine kinase [Oricola thermophila]QKV18666.1 HAMP domain-containing histidine kinase [Oricola thermophila]
MAYLRSISGYYEKVLCEMARRTMAQGQKNASELDRLKPILAERLISLGAGAVFLVAPSSIALGGTGAPGAYGAAAAIAFAFVAIPILALGWLSVSSAPWMVAMVAISFWSVLAGTLASGSPLVALASGLVLLKVASDAGAANKIRELVSAAGKGAEDGVGHEGAHGEVSTFELSANGTIIRADGFREAVFRPHRLFIDHVHLADRVAFLGAFADVAKLRSETAEVNVRLNVAAHGQTQSFAPAHITITRSGGGVAVTARETVVEADAPDASPETAAQKRFLATVSHELRTPLNSIIGFSDILKRDIFGALANERQREYVDLIHSSGKHLLSVVNTILDVSKIEAGTYAIHRERFDLNSMVEECVSMLRPQADAKGLSLVVETGPGIEFAEGDCRALKQVVINLLSNAVKFTEQGGEVRLATERRENGFAIRVSDTGIGMTCDELEQIGTPFMQADNSYTRKCEGTGLGLAVVKGLVQLHDGTLDVESAPGTGTRVTVFIPETGAGHSDRNDMALKLEEIAKARSGVGRESDNSEVQVNAVRLAG